MKPFLLVLALLGAGPAKKAPPAAPVTPRPIARTLTVTAENVREVFPLYAAPGQATWLLLPAQLAGQVVVAPELGPAQLQGTLLIFTPPSPLGDRRLPLVLPLAEGPPLIFEVQAAREAFDQRVTIERKLGALAGPDSPQVLGEQLQACKDQLEDARSGAAAADILTGVIADAARDRPPALMRRDVSISRKQSFVYVRITQVYRLFDWTFLVLELENREAGTLWALGAATVRQMGVDAPLPTSVRQERPAGLKGGESQRVVLGYPTPADNTKRLSITLTDKAGTRNVALQDLDL